MADPDSGGGGTGPGRGHHHHHKHHPPFGQQGAWRPFTPGQTYVFDGRLPNGNGFTFRVLAGYAAPKITAGLGAKTNVIDRPLELGFTIPVGYDPLAMDVPIQFEALTDKWTGRAAISDSIEFDIQKLDWMAGRGPLYALKNGYSTSGPAAGTPPLVKVESLDTKGSPTNLIPATVHGIDWLVSNIDYDNTLPHQASTSTQESGGVIRDVYGNRIRQAATVSLIQFIAAPGSDGSAASRQQARGKAQGYQSYRAWDGLDTIYKIVMYATAGQATWADLQKVLAFNRPRINVRSLNQKLPRGTVVQVPNSVLVQR